jgi:hypothetical protein
MYFQRSVLSDEITQLIAQRLEEIGRYLPSVKQAADDIPENILSCLERLPQLCQYPPESASYDQYLEVRELQGDVLDFLASMNRRLDRDFEQTSIGQIWLQASAWLQTAAQQFQPSIQAVWRLISPAQPDHLADLGNGVYEARWWKPVPMMDVEIIRLTEGVLVDGDAYEPANLKGGLALRFQLEPCLKSPPMD